MQRACRTAPLDYANPTCREPDVGPAAHLAALAGAPVAGCYNCYIRLTNGNN
jgi:hypothetical protein